MTDWLCLARRSSVFHHVELQFVTQQGSMQPVKYTHIDITIFKTKSPRGGVLNSIVSVQTW